MGCRLCQNYVEVFYLHIMYIIITYNVHIMYIIMEYGSTPYIGMAPKKNGCPIVCVQSDMFNTLPST